MISASASGDGISPPVGSTTVSRYCGMAVILSKAAAGADVGRSPLVRTAGSHIDPGPPDENVERQLVVGGVGGLDDGEAEPAQPADVRPGVHRGRRRNPFGVAPL